ncbi:hypothetical protein B0H21DRAFT_874504 [Amylocystis lapponica]|nr:hypothetical protein B0H21DRAFT_874504 [Amylocystis lapponica]
MPIETLLSTKAQKAFVLTILAQAIVVLVMVAITFAFVDQANVNWDEPRYKTLPCYLALFALAEVFELLMGLDALRLRNVIQLIGILAFHAAMLVMGSLQIHETRTALVTNSGADGTVDYTSGGGAGTLWLKVRPFLIVVPIIIAASWVSMIWCFTKLYHEFGWAIFHVVGANPEMKKMYQYYQILLCLLKFDFFAFTGVTMQLLIVVLQKNSAEFGLTITAIPVVLLLLAMTGFAVQREIKWIMTAALVVMLAAQTYFYKLVRFYNPESDYAYLSTRATLTVFTICASLLLFATFGIGCKCFYDFDQGLEKSKMHGGYYKPVTGTMMDSLFSGEKGEGGTYNSGAPLAERISIE